MRTFLPSALLSSALACSAYAAHGFDSFARGHSERSAVSVNISTVEMVATAWYAGWHADDFPLDAVSWDKYTMMTYSFGITVDDPSTIALNDSDVELLPKFVAQAHDNDVKAALSIGGWTGARFYSTNVGNEANRTQFVKAVTDLADKYNLDGIDFDWEYPGKQGIGCNTISPNDTSNFLAFLQALRATPTGSKLILSAATSITPFYNASGVPSSDVSPFAEVLDFIEVMNYDIWGSWSAGVGPNAPLNDTCAATADQQGSAVSAVKAWTAAGMPVSKIVLGVPSYGHSFSVNTTSAFAHGSTTALAAYPPFNASAHPAGDAWDDPPEVDVCGVLEPQAGEWYFRGLVAGGWLDANGSVAQGVPSRFDACSQTAYVYNATSEVMVSYDSPESFTAKGEFIKNIGLRGFAIWEAGGDSNDTLLDAIRGGVGLDDCDDW
ncbi:glycoside hydrolase [Phellopilus nigrolimitatus]|nr:glycoside hydrolase [Phellopilus nigrolimitatus]